VEEKVEEEPAAESSDKAEEEDVKEAASESPEEAAEAVLCSTALLL